MPLLLDLLTDVWRETHEPLFAQRIAETVGWTRARDDRAKAAALPPRLDADSEGEEGKFYVWTAAEIDDVLGAEDAAFFARVYDVTPEGNCEGHTILNRLTSLALLSRRERSSPCRGAREASRPREPRACARAGTTRCSPTGTG